MIHIRSISDMEEVKTKELEPMEKGCCFNQIYAIVVGIICAIISMFAMAYISLELFSAYFKELDDSLQTLFKVFGGIVVYATFQIGYFGKRHESINKMTISPISKESHSAK